METELTKKIKKRVWTFKPELPTAMRTIRYAEEVSTPTGICDVIRFEDYIEKDESYCRKISPTEQDMKEFLSAHRPDGKCKVEGESYKNKHCRGCFYEKHIHTIGMLITCYEVKITVSDFKSKNGHNFHGHRNYYVVPNEIVKKILPLAEEGVGVISYYPGSEHMKVVKECVQREVDKELQVNLLYDALKKWCDGKQVDEGLKKDNETLQNICKHAEEKYLHCSNLIHRLQVALEKTTGQKTEFEQVVEEMERTAGISNKLSEDSKNNSLERSHTDSEETWGI